MARRKVDTSVLQGLIEKAQNQVVERGIQRTADPNFPVFTTPVNQDIVVYIPRTNMVSTENGEEMQMLHSYIHEGRIGNHWVSLRCISGLAGDPLFDHLGYDGTCPACEAMADVWELYNLKLKEEAAKFNVDPQNDPNNTLKPVKEKLFLEMDLKAAEPFVTFPIVVIPTVNKMYPAEDALERLQPMFVHWRKTRYDNGIVPALQSLLSNPGHPAGMFWFWKFTYDTKGKQPNVRDSARNAKYTPITEQEALRYLMPLAQKCEEVAKEFTLVKAAEVVIAAQFMYREDIEKEVNRIMAKTRQLLEIAKMGGGQPQPMLNAGTAPTNPLLAFGGVNNNVGNSAVGTLEGALANTAPKNLGEDNDQLKPPTGGPISFQ